MSKTAGLYWEGIYWWEIRNRCEEAGKGKKDWAGQTQNVNRRAHGNMAIANKASSPNLQISANTSINALENHDACHPGSWADSMSLACYITSGNKSSVETVSNNNMLTSQMCAWDHMGMDHGTKEKLFILQAKFIWKNIYQS